MSSGSPILGDGGKRREDSNKMESKMKLLVFIGLSEEYHNTF